MVGIYKIESPSGKVYVGQSIDIERRWKEYYTITNSQRKLMRSFKKHGVKNHIFEVIEECTPGKLNSRERYWQEYYNVLKGGLNCRLTETEDQSGKLSKETIKKRSATKRKLGQRPPSKLGTKQSKEHIQKRINSRPDNIGELISKGKKGKSNGLKGRIYSKKQKDKLYESRRKKIIHIPTGTVYNSRAEAVESIFGSSWKVDAHTKGKVKNPEWKYL